MKKLILLIGIFLQLIIINANATPVTYKGVINKIACKNFYVGIKGYYGKQYYVYFVNINGQVAKWDKQLITMCQQNLRNGQRVQFSGNNVGNGKITEATIQSMK